MNEDLRGMIEFGSRWAEKHFRRHGSIMPMYHCITESGDTLITPNPSSDKDTAVALMKAMFELKRVVRYIFIDEAWMVDSTVEKNIDLDWIEAHGVRAHPNRREIVMFHGEDNRGNQIMGSRPILRPKFGRAALGPLRLGDMTDSASAGRMVGLLKIADEVKH